MRTILLNFVLLFFYSEAYCKIHNFTINKKNFSLDIPQEWRATKDLFGMPLTLSRPMVDKTRPVITITPTGIDKIQFKIESKNKNDKEDYRRARTKWLKKHNGRALSFDLYKKDSWIGIEEAHIVGFSYIINNISFTESSYYILCNKNLFHLKYLLRSQHLKYLNDSKKISRSFKCK